MIQSEIIKAAENMLNTTWVEPSQPLKDALEIIRSLIALVPRDGINHRELMAVEFGYRKCERGLNLEETFDKFKAMLKDAKEEK